MIVALLSWYDESPSALTRAVVPLARFCEHVVAIDGAYAAVPGAELAPSSPGSQADAVVAAAEGAGLGLTLHRPIAPWPSEVEKRDALFRAAGLVCTASDWLFVIDADELVRDVPADLHDRLAATEHDVAEIELQNGSGSTIDRRFVRWSPGLHVEGNHYTWVASTISVDHDDRLLRGSLDGFLPETAEHVPGFRLEHMQAQGERRSKQLAYYERRDRLGLETTARVPEGGSAVYAFEPRQGSRHFAMVLSPQEYEAVKLTGHAMLDGQRAVVVEADCDEESGFMRFCLDEPYKEPA